MNDWIQFLPLLAVLVVFYLLVLRPARQRQREVQNLQESLDIGQRVMLTSGFYGDVVSLGDETIEVRLAPDTVVTVARLAVARIDDEPTPPSS